MKPYEKKEKKKDSLNYVNGAQTGSFSSQRWLTEGQGKN